jgi:hypothetical protein
LESVVDSCVNLDFVAEVLEVGMGVALLWLRFVSRLLELDEKRFTSWQPEESVWPGGVAEVLQLGPFDAEIKPDDLTGFGLDLLLRPH